MPPFCIPSCSGSQSVFPDQQRQRQVETSWKRRFLGPPLIRNCGGEGQQSNCGVQVPQFPLMHTQV